MLTNALVIPILLVALMVNAWNGDWYMVGVCALMLAVQAGLYWLLYGPDPPVAHP